MGALYLTYYLDNFGSLLSQQAHNLFLPERIFLVKAQNYCFLGQCIYKFIRQKAYKEKRPPFSENFRHKMLLMGKFHETVL